MCRVGTSRGTTIVETSCQSCLSVWLACSIVRIFGYLGKLFCQAHGVICSLDSSMTNTDEIKKIVNNEVYNKVLRFLLWRNFEIKYKFIGENDFSWFRDANSQEDQGYWAGYSNCALKGKSTMGRSWTKWSGQRCLNASRREEGMRKGKY
jgi:hypothetical protein